MTYDELNNARELRREIQQLMHTRAALGREFSTNTAFPELERLIDEKKTRRVAELTRLENYIDTIEDSFTRQIFRARFVIGLSWEAIAIRSGGKNTASAIEKRCKRYLSKRNGG